MDTQPQREGFVEPSKPVTGNGGSGPIIDQLPIESAPPPSPVETWPVRVKLLHRPVRNLRGEMVHELVFREPTGGDINRYGNPCRINTDGDVVIDEAKMMRIIGALCGILTPNLDAMDPRDWNSCAYRLRNFFLPEVAAWLDPMNQ
jgi:hypothetical protein